MVQSVKKRAIIGMGKTGLSCARFLRTQGESFVWCDTRHDPPQLSVMQGEFPGVDFLCGPLDAGMLSDASEIIVSPGVSVRESALRAAGEAGVSLVGDIELFVRATHKPIIAITGSNAKSTVTTLVGDMAKACGLRAGVGGNLGTPVLDMLADDAQTDCYVLELSSFQLETTQGLRALAATVLNISDDHLDRYEGVADYAAVKQVIYRHAENVVCNRADAATSSQSLPKGKIWSFGIDVAKNDHDIGVDVLNGEPWLMLGADVSLMRVADIRIAGKHNLANVAAAFALAAAADWDLEKCADAVRHFSGLAHRCQWVAEKQGVRFYNDSKGTNVGATLAAIEGLAAGQQKNIVLIAGGEGKGADFSQLMPTVNAHVKLLVLIGRDAALIAAACSGVAQVNAASMSEAVKQAASAAVAGDVVLLSPACASFDMFNGYDDRGRQFCAAVEALS